MATIVKHKPTGNTYFLIGTGYGAYVDTRPSLLGGDLFPNRETGELPLAAVCDRSGEIEWHYTEELIVIEIDGSPLAAIWNQLDAKGGKSSRATKPDSVEKDNCPACGHVVEGSDKECPSCGLVFIASEGEGN